MKLIFTRLSFILVGVVLLSSCSVNKPIQYKMSDIQKSETRILKKTSLSIMEFSDERQKYRDNDILFVNGREWVSKDTHYCINAESHYNKAPVSRQITMQFVEHLKQKNMFKSVKMGDKAGSDYYLTGSIHKFFARQLFSKTASTGASATVKTKTSGHIEVLIKDLILYDKNDQIVARLDDINKIFDGALLADAYCWNIYQHVNKKLKTAIEEKIGQLERFLAEITIDKYSNL